MSEIPLFSPYVEISLDNLIHNLNQIKNSAPDSMAIMAVIKDNAYGCGSVMVARALEAHQVRFFAVANPGEARALRTADIRSPILVLGDSGPEEMRWGAKANVRFALNDLADLQIWNNLGCPVLFHANIDTGMGRLGIALSETPALINILKSSPQLTCEGVFTHLANADGSDTGTISRQLAHFRKVLNALHENAVAPRHIHYANSAAIMRYPLEECTMVRPGIALFGCKPDPRQDFPLDLKPVLSLKTRIVKMKRVPAGTPISYGSSYVTETETTIATIALGYGQGLPRQLSNRGSVLIGGRRYRIAGRVTMDFIMVDAGTNPDMSVGDEVVALGNQGTANIHPDDIALLCNTIGYEILCNISSTIDRLYILDGKILYHEPIRPF
ncbi:MAG: alanine racemase [Chitinivibrionales bacterium]